MVVFTLAPSFPFAFAFCCGRSVSPRILCSLLTHTRGSNVRGSGSGLTDWLCGWLTERRGSACVERRQIVLYCRANV